MNITILFHILFWLAIAASVTYFKTNFVRIGVGLCILPVTYAAVWYSIGKSTAQEIPFVVKSLSVAVSIYWGTYFLLRKKIIVALPLFALMAALLWDNEERVLESAIEKINPPTDTIFIDSTKSIVKHRFGNKDTILQFTIGFD